MNKIKEALRSGKHSIGTWMQIPNTEVAEILSTVGFDWICLDLEHGFFSLADVAHIFSVLEKRDIETVVRLPLNDPIWIRRVLDIGARTIIVPFINNASEAEQAMLYAKYPPEGKRGFGYCRANNYGNEFDHYAKISNEEIAIIAQIEHQDAILNLKSICECKYIDATFIGPYDLSGSINSVGPGNFEHPDFQQMIQDYLDTSKKMNKPTGMHLVKPDTISIQNVISKYQFIALGTDAIFMRNAAVSAIMQTKGSIKI